MAPEAAAEGYYMTPCCGEADMSGYSRTSSPDPNVFYDGHEDKRAYTDGRCAGSQYHSWPTPAGFTAYPSNDAKTYAPSPYSMPPHGVPPMPVHMPSVPYGHGAAGQMVAPQPPMFGVQAPRTPTRTRADITDTSSSNCTPRDHYSTAMDRPSPVKRHARKHDAGPRFPVVKIPEGLKKQGGQPSPATWLNMRGFPLRAGKPDCKHYTTKGWCAYGTLCKFNHPDNMPAATMPYGMVPCVPGSQPMVMNGPWMGLHYQWNGPWNQHHHQSSPAVPHAYPPYMCHPCHSGPCSTESGHTAISHSDGREHEKVTVDTETSAMMYH